MANAEKKSIKPRPAFGDNGFGGINGYLDLRKNKLHDQFKKKQNIQSKGSIFLAIFLCM